MRISYIGKFGRLHDEEYIARSFESLNHEVQRIDERNLTHQITGLIEEFSPSLILMAKGFMVEPEKVFNFCKERGIPTISWTFDLYWDYPREERITKTPAFKCDYVVTSDGGHQEKWDSMGIKHFCVRQGIYEPECEMVNGNPGGVVFVGSINPLYPYRQKVMNLLKDRFKLNWYGQNDTNAIRGMDLNQLYADSKVIVGDSVYSPHYWSNRIVETLGRGGFLIHQEVPGLKEEYPHLVTYSSHDPYELIRLIDYYLIHEEERLDILRKNFEWVKERYTMKHKCQELLNIISSLIS